MTDWRQRAIRIKWLALTLGVVAACTPAMQDEVARDAARTAVRPVLARNFPGVPLEPATDCVINNATANEILVLAADAVTGPTASTVEVVGNIAARPGTIECLAREGLPAVLSRL
ncbi:MAG: hypothetical protein HKN98_09700 [Silicimonas sp.]|nr:hypothetical protein [Silicimonas sp.]NND18838.1 hypothetical protein [Silicimonas sp.]NND21743.1 hypothetical protein [Silicimonas sp.]NNL73773.1 hypothetical protein [Silicimonas sp.]RZW00148.1 MAG: hypothetical protein EX266_14260 [Paracoccaceae bacterium]